MTGRSSKQKRASRITAVYSRLEIKKESLMDENQLKELLDSAEAPPEREHRAHTAARKLVVSGSMDVVFHPSDKAFLVVAVSSADDLESVETIARGDTLEVRVKPITIGSGSFETHVHGSGRVTVNTFGPGSTVKIDMSGRKTVIASGSGARAAGGGNAHTVIASGTGAIAAGGNIIGASFGRSNHARVFVFQPEAPDVRVTGSGDVVLSDVQRSSIDLRIEGSGTIKVNGTVDTLTAHIAGSGDIKAKKLVSRVATCFIDGSGDVKVNAHQSIRARISGVGEISVYGNPSQRDVKVSGIGSVRFKERT
jgi:hypothetical protein